MKQINPPLAAPLCEMIHSFHRAEKVMVASFNSRSMNDFRRTCSGIATSASRREVALFFLMNLVFLGTAYRPACHALQIPEFSSGLHVLSKRFLQTARIVNLKVHVWTINQMEDMKRLLKLGVDGIITDYPDQLISLLAHMKGGP